MISVQHDLLVSFRDLAAALPLNARGKRVASNTIHRWATLGLRGVKLDSVWIGPTHYTTWEAFEAFTAARSGKPRARVEPSAACLRADRELESMGL